MKPFKYDFNRQTESYSLAIFRVAFGVLMAGSLLRFWAKGWIELLYIEPDFHFSYLGFSWVKPIGSLTYLIFLSCFLASIAVVIGYKYRLAILLFFLSFTYIELMDKTTYLNHYYFVSVLSFMMIFLPCAATFSLDAKHRKSHKTVPKWTVDSLKALLLLIYFYAGLAKINSDWLFQAMPLKIWLKAKYEIPVIGPYLLQQDWVHFVMSWGGMLYDISIGFFLLNKKTRPYAFVLVLIFHVLTKILFPAIGMFPYIMIFGCLIFFDNTVHKGIISQIKKRFLKGYDSESVAVITNEDSTMVNKESLPMQRYIILTVLILQFLIPLRHHLYPGELFWTEQGYRFSWRVMLVEKMGYTTLKIVDSDTGDAFVVNNRDFLTEFQEKQMSFQPDFILEYAHYLGDYYMEKGMKNVKVFAESYVTLNGRRSRQFIDPKVDLYAVKRSLKHKNWIIPYHETIKKL